MDLKELFPKNPTVTLDGKEYKLIYNNRARIALDEHFDSIDTLNAAFNSGTTKDGMKPSNIFKLLHGLLAGAKNPIDKEKLIDVMVAEDYSQYVNAIFAAIMNARLTPEQIEQLEVMNAQADSKKNAVETTSESTPITEPNAE